MDSGRATERGIVLLLGGTTEGRQAAALLERLEMPFIYSTKRAVSRFPTAYGEFRHGALDMDGMAGLVALRRIRMVIDAAHPFACRLHWTAFASCNRSAVRLIRFERALCSIPVTGMLHFVSGFPDALSLLARLVPQRLLALTGVQSVAHLQPWWSQHVTFLRVLPSPSSIGEALGAGFPESGLLPMQPDGSEADLEVLVRSLAIDCLLAKESGDAGFLPAKIRVAERCGIPAIVIRRPPAPPYREVVSSIDELEALVGNSPPLKALRTGYTTGACAAAASKAAMIALLDGAAPASVTIALPSGRCASFAVQCPSPGPLAAICGVRKDAGDDPDVTDGLVIFSKVSLLAGLPGNTVRFLQGDGVGRVTLPGFEIPPGEPAINPVPRRMIREAVVAELRQRGIGHSVAVTISVPGGAEIAHKTMNARLGITGGISILGTSGEVKPYSVDAWLASIRQAIYVAGANACTEISLTSGLRTERLLRSLYPELADLACIHYGNHIGRSLELVAEHGGFDQVFVAVMLAKATKLAQGEADLSSRVVSLRPGWLAGLARDLGYGQEVVRGLAELTLVRSMTGLVPFESTEPLYRAIAASCRDACRNWLPGVPLTFVLFDMDGKAVLAD